MKTVRVDTNTPYDILIERGLLDRSGELVRSVSAAKKACVITDSNVGAIYAERVLTSLKEADFETELFTFPAGESSKRLDTVAAMLSYMADFHMSRGDIVVALGGGVTGDMAGFAAGKTAVDIPQGKNLVGAFHQPCLVIIDPDTLSTLPERFVHDGMAEVIKYGCIKDERLFETLENENALDIIEDIIEICVSIKRDVVNRDEKESGERMLLNFGHTLGHSLEKLYNFEGLSHGEAVAIGMVKIAASGENAGLTEAGTADRIERLCKKNMLPTSDEASAATLAELCQSDKKAGGGSVNLVLLDKIGSSFIRKTPLSELEAFIR